MASEKVMTILRSRSAPFSEDELRNMSDAEGWKWIYSNHKPKAHRPKDTRIEVCFTGFDDCRKECILKMVAQKPTFKVAQSVTKRLAYLVLGPNPGPKKIATAKEQGVRIIDWKEFEIMFDHGVLPNGDSKEQA